MKNAGERNIPLSLRDPPQHDQKQERAQNSPERGIAPAPAEQKAFQPLGR